MSQAPLPNPRLQRTRAALLLKSVLGERSSSGGDRRAPLSRQPLGAIRKFAVAVAMALAAGAVCSSTLSREIEFSCVGLEDYDIRVTYDVDSGFGSIRSKRDAFSVGLGLGPMIEQSIPAARRAGLRWMKTETLGRATLRYGFDVRLKMLQATIVRAPINSVVDLGASARDQSRFLTVARALATAPCQSKRSPYHSPYDE